MISNIKKHKESFSYAIIPFNTLCIWYCIENSYPLKLKLNITILLWPFDKV